jgi:hypothetical protein
VPLLELVGNNNKNVDYKFTRNFGNNGYGNNYNNYDQPPYTQNNYGSRPFIPYPQSNENRWKSTMIPQTHENPEKKNLRRINTY